MNINSSNGRGLFIRRADAVKAIEAWAERNKDKPLRKPDIVARLMAEKVEAVKSVEIDPAYYTKLRMDFGGINISFGKCGNCGERLMWYAKAPINGCPYCYYRFGENKGEK